LVVDVDVDVEALDGKGSEEAYVVLGVGEIPDGVDPLGVDGSPDGGVDPPVVCGSPDGAVDPPVVDESPDGGVDPPGVEGNPDGVAVPVLDAPGSP
jgi:hypothetical protein